MKNSLNDINKLIGSKDLYTSEVPLLTEIIKLLKHISEQTSALQKLINDLKWDIKLLKGKLSGLDAEKKLNDLLAKVLDHKNWLSYLESDIEKLI